MIPIFTLIFILLLVNVQAKNELSEGMLYLDVSDARYQERIDSDLCHLNWAAAGLAGGSTLVAGIAFGSYQLAKAACSPSIGNQYFYFWTLLTFILALLLLLLVILLLNSFFACY